MAAYRRVYDSRHLQADCQEPGSAPDTYAWQSSMGYIYLFQQHVVLAMQCIRLQQPGGFSIYPRHFGANFAAGKNIYLQILGMQLKDAYYTVNCKHIRKDK